MSWNSEEGGHPTDFLDLLYDEDDELENEIVGDSEEDEDLTESEEDEEVGEPEGQSMGEAEPCEAPMTSRSPMPQAPYAAAAAASSPPVVDPCAVVITVPVDDDNNVEMMEEDRVFHLADEHQLFQQVEDVVEEQQLRRLRRGGATRRGRGRGRGARGQDTSLGPQWVRGDRLVLVHVNDDDVPEDLKASVMRIVNAREAERVRMVNRARREREQNDEDSEPCDEIQTFDAEGSSNRFDWSPVMADFQGEREQFLPQQTGAVVAAEDAYGAFRQYWDEDIMTLLVNETNRYAAVLCAASVSFARDWYDTNVHELLVLFSFWMMLGIIRMPSIKSCFTTDPLMQTNIFRKMFSRHRYENLCRAFNLFDNSSRPTDTTDVLYALGPIVDMLNARFQRTYIPSQNMALTLCRGNISFRQYIKTMAAQYGIKTFELCESATGYLWSFFVYRGAGTSYNCDLPSTTLKPTTTVLSLIKPLLNKGYTLFMDNWFNSPLLARFLKARKTDCVGTLRANRTDVPPLMSLCKLKDGQFVARHSGDVVVLAFQDNKRKIATISTYHGDSQGRTEAKPDRPSLYKPSVVLDYNKVMGGVDRKDSMLEPYLLERKRGKKWSTKFFKHLLNCSILNSRILLQSSSASLKEHLAFRLELVSLILRHHQPHVPKASSLKDTSSSLSHSVPEVQHLPRQTNELEATGSGRRKRRRCYLCSQNKIKRQTSWTCTACEVPLCANPCFELFHRR